MLSGGYSRPVVTSVGRTPTHKHIHKCKHTHTHSHHITTQIDTHTYIIYMYMYMYILLCFKSFLYSLKNNRGQMHVRGQNKVLNGNKKWVYNYIIVLPFLYVKCQSIDSLLSYSMYNHVLTLWHYSIHYSTYKLLSYSIIMY